MKTSMKKQTMMVSSLHQAVLLSSLLVILLQTIQVASFTTAGVSIQQHQHTLPFLIITPPPSSTRIVKQSSFSTSRSSSTSTSTQLHSLKPAAIPLLDSGKALARSGELLIDYTSSSTYKLYGGGLSSSGASIRNAGDCIAQAAASMRFKTASELVIDELRESGTCLLEGAGDHLPKGVDDAIVDGYSADGDGGLAKRIECLISDMKCVGDNLELAGERIMKADSVGNIGTTLVDASDCLSSLALGIQKLGDENTVDMDKDGQLIKENDESVKAVRESCNRMLYAAEKMKEAGNNLKGVLPAKKKGKAWLKG